MTIPNKEIIQAYLDGKCIQYKHPRDKWIDFNYNFIGQSQPNPMSHNLNEWRIKPTQAELDYQRFESTAFSGDGGKSLKSAYMQGWIDGNLAGKKELTESKT